MGHNLDNLHEKLCEELEMLDDKARKEPELSETDYKRGDMVAHFLKSLVTYQAMMDAADEYENGYSEDSYARRGQRQDSMGRYSREGGNRGGQGGGSSYRRGGGSYRGGASYARGRRGYSRGGENDDAIERLEEMMEKATTESERQAYQKAIRELEDN